MPSALEQLLGKKGAAQFLSRAWPDAHFVQHRRVADLPLPLRSPPLNRFDALAAVYSGRVQVAGGEGVDHLQFTVSSEQPEYLRRIGLTVFFGDDVSGLAEGGAAFLRGLEAELGAPAGIGAIRTFASPAGGGLGAHYDQGETFIVQLHGTKRLWLAANTTYPAMQFAPGKPPSDEHYAEFAGRGFPAGPPRRGTRVTLKPGSVLFVPRGMWHRTEAGTQSFSASICVDIPNAIDVLLPQLKLALRQNVRMRRPLFGTRAEQHAQLEEALSLAAAALPRMSAQLMLDATGEVQASRLPIRAGTRFQRVPSTKLALRGRRLGVTTWAGAREATLEISSVLLPAVRWVARRRPAFTFAELSAATGAKESELRALLASLLETEALRWLTFPELR